MQPAQKLGLDFGPLIIFLVGYYALGIYPATGIFIVATIIAGSVSYWLTGKVSPLMIVSGVFVLVLGGLTLWLQDDSFIRMKPTIYYFTVAGILFGGLAFNRLLVKDVMDLAMHLKDEGWEKFTVRLGLFFLAMAVLNIYVAQNYSFETWLWFKLWGFIPLTTVFFVAQVPLFARYEVKQPEENTRPT